MRKMVKNTWKPTKVSAHARVRVTLDFTCPLCKKEQEVTLSDTTIIGGCTGGHGEGEYCYCPNPHYEETVNCIGCEIPVELES